MLFLKEICIQIRNHLILQKVNKPSFPARAIKNYLQPQEVQGVLQQMARLPQSPDPDIESVWDYMKEQKTVCMIQLLSLCRHSHPLWFYALEMGVSASAI